MPLTAPQKKVIKDDSRFRVLITGRRFGKTYLAINELAKFASQPNKKVWYVAPSYRQAKAICWGVLKEKMIQHKWVKGINHSDLTITLKNNSQITLRGSDNENSLRGVGLHGLVMDEFADISKETSEFAGFIKSDISEEQDGSQYRYGLRYTEFVGILIKALQEADDKIDALTARVTALESE